MTCEVVKWKSLGLVLSLNFFLIVLKLNFKEIIKNISISSKRLLLLLGGKIYDTSLIQWCIFIPLKFII